MDGESQIVYSLVLSAEDAADLRARRASHPDARLSPRDGRDARHASGSAVAAIRRDEGIRGR